MMVEFQPQRAIAAGAAVQADGDACVVGQGLQHGDIGERIGGVVARLIGLRKGIAVIADRCRIDGGGHQRIAESGGQLLDARFQFGAAGARRRPGHAPDDDVQAHEIAFGEMRVIGRNAAIILFGQILGDAGARRAVIAVARHEDEDGDEIVEAVDARQHPHAGPVVKPGNGGGEFEQFVGTRSGTARRADSCRAR